MIRFITTPAHYYTVAALSRNFGAAVPPHAVHGYDEFFSSENFPAGTYVFTDMERLSDLELLLAADYFRLLAGQPGFRLLNDPARAKTRFALLRRLKQAGINDFDAYRADGRPRPARFPAFVRAEAAHDAALTGLVADQATLDAELARLEESGRPLRGLVVIEYCAEPIAPGLFRRWGTFAIGGHIHLDHVVTEDTWNVKWGKAGLATEEHYRRDDDAVRANHHADVLARAFREAGIDYGRADFGLVGGRPQIYEINTNPSLGELEEHRSATRMATMAFAHQRFASLLGEIDTPPGPPAWVPLAALSPAGREAAKELQQRREAWRLLAAQRRQG